MRIWEIKQRPRREPKFHKAEILMGAGKSTSAWLAIFSRGCVLRRLVMELVLVVELQRWFFKPLLLVKTRAGIMTFLICIFLLMLVLGLVAVASNPSPYFAALGLVMVAGVGCGVLVGYGGSFLSLVLFLIYLGGMLVVFAYSAALAAEPFPETWGNRPIMASMVLYVLVLVLVSGLFWEHWYEHSWVPVEEGAELAVCRGDVEGVALIYSSGGQILIISA